MRVYSLSGLRKIFLNILEIIELPALAKLNYRVGVTHARYKDVIFRRVLMISPRSKCLLVAISILLTACSDGGSTSPTLITEKLKENKDLTKNEKCIVDTVISSAIDRNNLLVYAAGFDVLSRYSVVEAAQQINFCRPMINGSRSSDMLASISEGCPKELKQLEPSELDSLESRAIELAQRAANFKGSVFEFAFGSCVQ